MLPAEKQMQIFPQLFHDLNFDDFNLGIDWAAV